MNRDTLVVQRLVLQKGGDEPWHACGAEAGATERRR